MQNICIICQEYITLYPMPCCGTGVCFKCVRGWDNENIIKKKNTCPNCRHEYSINKNLPFSAFYVTWTICKYSAIVLESINK